MENIALYGEIMRKLQMAKLITSPDARIETKLICRYDQQHQ